MKGFVLLQRLRITVKIIFEDSFPGQVAPVLE
jgi:hypothetical protein